MASGYKEFIGTATVNGETRKVAFRHVNFRGDVKAAKALINKLSPGKYSDLDIKEVKDDPNTTLTPEEAVAKPDIE